MRKIPRSGGPPHGEAPNADVSEDNLWFPAGSRTARGDRKHHHSGRASFDALSTLGCSISASGLWACVPKRDRFVKDRSQIVRAFGPGSFGRICGELGLKSLGPAKDLGRAGHEVLDECLKYSLAVDQSSTHAANMCKHASYMLGGAAAHHF